MTEGARGSVWPMMRASMVVSLLLAVSGFAAPSFAQTSAPAGEPAVVMTAPTQSAAARNVWFERDLEAAKERSTRSRNALIGTSAVVGLGAILFGAGASQCDWNSLSSNQDEWICNNAGDVLVPLGGTFIGLGAIGMITSGIILGVANKRKREIQRDMRRGYYGGRLRWDARSGGLVF